MSKTALLVIDVQKAILAEKPYQQALFMKHLEALVKTCRQADLEVIYVQHCETDGDLQKGKESWQIVESIAPQEDERIFEKTYNSAFKETGLNDYLKKQAIETLILTGMQTNYCIDASVKVAFEYGYRLIMPEMTNTTVDTPLISGEKLYRHYNEDIYKGRFAAVPAFEDFLEAIRNHKPL